jgi:hypothetical protein
MKDRKTRQRRALAMAARMGSALVAMGTPLALRAATTLSFTSSKDNTLYENLSGSLSNGAGDAFFSGITGGGGKRRGLIAFDLTSGSFPTNATVTSTTVSLYDDKSLVTNAFHELRKVLKNWGEGTSDAGPTGGGGAPSTTGDATWIHTYYNTSFWTSPGGDYSSTQSASGLMSPTFTTTFGSTAQLNADVQGWLNNPAANFGWIVLGDESGFGNAARIASNTYFDTSKRPQLSVTYNASQWVTGSGLWSTASNWAFGVPGAVGAEATFNFPSGSGITTVTIDSPRTLGTLKFNSSNYNFIGSTLTLDRAAAPVTMNVTGLLQISANLNVNKNAEIIVNSGGLLTLGGTVTAAAGVTYHKTGSGMLQMSNIRSAGLTIDGGSVAVFPTDLASGVSKVTSLVINSGKLNLQANKLVTATSAGTWTGSGYTGVTGMVVAGRGTSNLWDGSTGIVTAMPDAVGSNYTSLGVAQASDVRPATATATDLWAGQTITGTDTLVMYTYGGDATLDGKINIDDYVKIDSGIAGGYTGWSNGDFNYDGKVTIDDYITVIDANIGNQTGTFFTGSGDVSSGVVAVPEPTGVAATIALLLPAFMRRCRTVRSKS